MTDHVFRDPTRPMGERADDLLARLGPGERLAMLHQHGPAVDRLGIAPFVTGTEALHGLAWRGEATVYPQAIGLGASFDPDLVREVGEAVGREVRARHRVDPSVGLNVWAPVVNLLRDPRWGRNEEGYAEDPWLTSLVAIAFCRGLAGEDGEYLRCAPTLKHFLAYNNETDRTRTSSTLRPRVLHEYDLAPFREVLRAGSACALMPSYNLVNGRPAHVSPYLGEYARQWAPRELLVCSDALAPSHLVDEQHYFPDHAHAHAAALLAGVDSFTDHDTDPGPTLEHLRRALGLGLITQDDVDRAVRRQLLVRLRLGEFDPDGGPYASDPAGDALAGGTSPDGRALARRAAAASMVLLKNDGLLPLDRERCGRVAVVGPLAEACYEDWYSGTMPYRVTVAEGLAAALGADPEAVASCEALDRVALRSRSAPVLELGEFDLGEWGEGVVTLRSSADGRYLTVKEDGRLLADQSGPNGWVVRETFVLRRLGDGYVTLRSCATGRYVARSGDGLELRAVADEGGAEPLELEVLEDGLTAATAAMAGADLVVAVVGNHPLVNGREEQDRAGLELPPAQDRLVRAAAGAHGRVLLVVMSSYPYAIDWAAEHVPAIMWTCHAGQETGNALADLVFGEREPTGRLPQTWHRGDDPLPDLLEYDIVKARRTYWYLERPPLYPFGHGLGYAEMVYEDVRVALKAIDADADEPLLVWVRVRNASQRAGTAVVQLYARWEERSRPGGSPLPRRLCALDRVEIGPDEVREIAMRVPLDRLRTWDVATGAFVLEPGRIWLYVGPPCADAAVGAAVTVCPGSPVERDLQVGIVAVDFDDYEDVTIVPAAPARGDAVASRSGGPALLRYGRIGAGDRGRPPAGSCKAVALLMVAAERGGAARVQLRSAGSEEGELLGVLEVESTGGLQQFVEQEMRLCRLPGDELLVVLEGPVRLARLRVLEGVAPAPRSSAHQPDEHRCEEHGQDDAGDAGEHAVVLASPAGERREDAGDRREREHEDPEAHEHLAQGRRTADVEHPHADRCVAGGEQLGHQARGEEEQRAHQPRPQRHLDHDVGTGVGRDVASGVLGWLRHR